MATVQGTPCWFELATSPGNLQAAEEFYCQLLGWSAQDAGMSGFTYHLARAGGDMVAGMMVMPPEAGQMPPFWMVYFATPDGDATVAAIEAAGGRIHRPLAEIPGTGRFAIAADPQGAAFGILEPAPMDAGSPGGNAFDQAKPGHGNWVELMSTDPDAGFDFYAKVFGFTKTREMPMGEMGNYRIFALNGTDIGGMMSLGRAPSPAWMPYFGTESTAAGASAVTGEGGSVVHGPADVPGGAKIVIALDPQGAAFGLVGPA